MARIDVPFVVEKQRITQPTQTELMSGGHNYFYATFRLCDTWEDISSIKAVFCREGNAVLMPLEEGNECLECLIPWEVMTEKGAFEVGIFGDDRLLTNLAYVKVGQGCITEGDEPKPPTPDWFKMVEELLSKISTPDWSQSDSSKSDYIKNRTHYTETVLLCDYTHTLDVETWEGEDFGGYFTLDKELNVDKLKLYINGEYVPTIYMTGDSDNYAFFANIEEGFVFEYIKSEKFIHFPPWLIKGNNYKVCEETIHQLDLKYIPDAVPTMTECEKELICQYTYDSADYSDGNFVGIIVNKKLTKENFAVYVNGEKVHDISFSEEDYTDGSFFAFYESIIFYNYTDDTVVFYPLDTDGTVIQIYEENFNALKDEEISNAIARTQYVDKRFDIVDGQIGDVETALDTIIAIQNELIGGDSE